MEHLMLISTVVDLGAVVLLGWLVLRGGRERETALGVQQSALESLRADLSQLVLEAERRTNGLAEMLGEREERLRGLLAEIARVDSPAPRRPAPAAEVRRPARVDEDDERDAFRQPAVDPAEARLLRDLQLSFGSREA
jgi:hypothetical protein